MGRVFEISDEGLVVFLTLGHSLGSNIVLVAEAGDGLARFSGWPYAAVAIYILRRFWLISCVLRSTR